LRAPQIVTLRERFLGGQIATLVPPKLDAAAEAIGSILDVRYIIFGHTHRPVVREVRSTPPAWYVNTGCWLVPRYKERHQGGCRSPLTFGLLVDRSVPELQLLRWCQRNSKAEPYQAHLLAEEDVPEVTELRGADTPSEPPIVGEEPTHPAPPRRRRGMVAARASLRKQR
jgi:hypothetical protein